MKALQIQNPQAIENSPLINIQREIPKPAMGQLLIQVSACGLCHTDLHTVEGDIRPPNYPIIPGHQVVGTVKEVGGDVEGWTVGDLVGVPWLYKACGTCDYCLRGEENLCEAAQFTGFHRDGGYAEWIVSEASHTLKIPASLSPVSAAPLLCAGIIGYRSLRKADLAQGERLGLVGFGASAHLAIQVAHAWHCQVYVFTRSQEHRQLAEQLGACWVGGAEDEPDQKIDRAVIFAPAGHLVPTMLARLRPGGTLAINAIHMTPIPQMNYDLIYGERTLRSVANATLQDGVDFLELASSVPVETRVQVYPLEDANRALQDLKGSRINGAGVLTI